MIGSVFFLPNRKWDVSQSILGNPANHKQPQAEAHLEHQATVALRNQKHAGVHPWTAGSAVAFDEYSTASKWFF